MVRDSSERADDIKGLLVRELRGAVTEAVSGGADPGAVHADLVRRLRRIRHMQRYERTRRTPATPMPVRPTGEAMSMSERISKAFVDAVNGMTADPAEIYQNCRSYSLAGWRGLQLSLVGGSGAVAAAIPVLHLATLTADTLFIINRMGTAAYGVGSILGREAGQGNIVERDDFGMILAYWTGDEQVRFLMTPAGVAKVSAEISAKMGVKTGTKIFGKGFVKGLPKVMLASAGWLVAGKFGGKGAVKAGAKFGAKFAGKLGAGWIPVLGAVVAGGVNVWLIESIMSSAEDYYRDKIQLIRSV
ncbi:hypothetical protein O7632_01895 [Solwaraspora sp. WMMD406]|uniref:hypothetical protein n=1 Tax=Solwaraspora sp. WMMD406 TaxID=3016095 RepID=UPI002415DBA4|nr:hypothetical protein [Solwaraspora sp. WMMD406]MDG4762873.1 hypothetical protein [Solwaraspora sp. WMMD406]